MFFFSTIPINEIVWKLIVIIKNLSIITVYNAKCFYNSFEGQKVMNEIFKK